MLRDSVNLYNDHQGLPCFSCHKFDHHTSHCTLVNLRVDKELVNFRHIYNPEQKRNSEGRNSLRRRNIIQSLTHKQVCSQSLKRIRLYYEQELYGSSQNDEEESQLQSEDNSHVREEKMSSFITQKNTIDEKILLYKTDKEFFMNVQKIRQKDLQQYFAYLKQENQAENDCGNITQLIQEEQTLFDEDDEKYDENNSQSTPSKGTNDSSFRVLSAQKLDKNNQNHISQLNQIPSSNQKESSNSFNFTTQALMKIGQDSNATIESRGRSNTNNSLNNEQQILSHQNISDAKRHSIYKQLNYQNKRGSQLLSGVINNPESISDTNSPYHNQKMQSTQNSLQYQEEEKLFGDMPELQLIKKKFKLSRQTTNDVKDFQQQPDDNQPMTPSRAHQQNNKKVAVSAADSYKKRMSISFTKRKSISLKGEQESMKNPNFMNTSVIQEQWNNIPAPTQKQRLLNKQIGLPNNYLYEIPAKYYDIFDQFDKFKNYIYYFPAFNISTVLKEQRRKAYQQLLTMRYHKLQVATKPLISLDIEKSSGIYSSPKKLVGHQLSKHQTKK